MGTQLPVKFDVVRKQLFVENLTIGLSPVDAAIASGFEHQPKRVATMLLEDEDVVAMIEAYKEQLKRKYDVSREQVLRDLVDAKEMARVQGDVKGMVMSLKEVSEVMGYHAPKQVSVDQRHTITQENAKHRLRQIPDDQLLELAEEADFEVVELREDAS